MVHESMKRKQVTDFLKVALMAVPLAACAYAKPNPTDPAFQGQGSPTDPNMTRMTGNDNSLFTFGNARTRPGDPSGGGIGVNAFLWRGALDTLSFVPLASADPFGGVIITDWYSSADAPGERFKATAYVMGRELRGDGIRVSVFRQVNRGGLWADAPVNPMTRADIENKVLDRARQLRERSSTRS